jgi:hypothetical protein
LKDARGPGFITTSRYVPRPTRSSRAVGRFSPRSAPAWTLAAVRRHLQALLLARLPRCPLCRQPTGSAHQPRGPSRM